MIKDWGHQWPFVEAQKLVERYSKSPPKKGYVLFETGYGPSGLPHIGTFGEVARTSMVRYAFQQLSDIPTRLFAFSDDMDGLRKVPDNVPNQDLLREHLGKPLTQIPDPFGTANSFGEHNNERLKAFLDSFGFEYEFQSSTQLYKAGFFDEYLLKVLENYDAIMDIMLPSLGAERQATYSPFLPICPKTGIVLQVPIIERNLKEGLITYLDPETETKVVTSIFGGSCKLQWKVDWAMRWATLDVDYEMAGKDLIDSVKLATKIVRVLGKPAPEGFNYELFLDAQGQKISKSKGNGLSMEDWLTYAPHESLALYMFQSPKSAKKLHFDVIPRQVDDYLTWVTKYETQLPEEQVNNPVWHLHQGKPPVPENGPSFSMLLNLVGVCNTEKKDVLWEFLTRYSPNLTPEKSPFTDKLLGYAIQYYKDFIVPTKQFRIAKEIEIVALQDLIKELKNLKSDATSEEVQFVVYEIGKKYPFEDLRAWFKVLYEVLLGQLQGPRMGSFFALYGIDNSISLIEESLNRK
jgi:lysyl-tRNA synthetase, class I